MNGKGEAAMSESNEYYEVVSGRPDGEAYHREVWVCLTRDDADAAIASIYDGMQDHEKESWLWGPHLNGPFCEHPDSVVWDGHELVPAPIWGGEDQYRNRC